jgi:hypothetical protein
VSFRSNEGFSFLFVLFAIVVVGLTMMGANQQWTTMMKREREAELLFRGHQYRLAIARYVESVPGARRYPPSVDDLLKDPRTSKRHLRTAYLDPITRGPFHAVPCREGVKGIKGVYSPSGDLTLKHDNFPPDYETFRGSATYREWIFQYEPAAAAAAQPPPGVQAAPPAAPAIPPVAC